MRLKKNGLCKILLVILFLAFISGGCGGGSSGSGGNSQSYNGNGNNGGQSGEINGTWVIVSGHGEGTSNGRTIHYTYAPGRVGEIDIEISKNNYGYGNPLDNFYAVTMAGNEIINSGSKGASAVIIDCTVDEYNDGKIRPMMTLGPLPALEYIGNGTYQMTDKTTDNLSGVNSNVASFEYVLILEDSDTLRYTHWSKTKEASTTLSVEGQYEIVLKRAGSSYNPDDYTNNTAPNTNTNTNNNTSPTPNTNTNTNTQPDIPPQISGSWQIASGSGLTSQTVSGKVYVSHLTYSPQRNDKAFDIDITQNDSTTYYYGEHAGLFSLTLTGDNIISSGVKGFGALRVYYSVAEAQGKETSFTFTGGKSFSYIGSGTYRLSFSNGTSYHEQTITLENESTIRWKYTVPSDGWYEIVLTKE